MCTYSMIADHYQDKFAPIFPTIWPQQTPTIAAPQISRDEFDALRRDVLEMKELLKKAAEYDKRNNEPDCEMEEKLALLRKVAEFVGIPDAVKPAE